MRLACCLLSVLSVFSLSFQAHAAGTELLPFQEITELPSRSSLTIGDTRYDTPDDLSTMPFVSGAVALDNFGAPDDAGRLASSLNLHGLLDSDDLLSLRSMGTAEQGHYHWGAYQLNLGPWRSRVGVMVSDLAYELGDELEILAAKGKTQTASAFIVQPLFDSQALSLKARLQYDDKRLHDEVGILRLDSQKRSRVLDYGLSATARDHWLSDATTSLALNWRVGSLNIDGSPYTLVGKADPGQFRVLRASLARLQELGAGLSLYTRAVGQWTNDNLDDSEKLYIGGVFGVRAAEQADAFGDRGWLANVELRYALSDTWQLLAFADHGQARLNTPSLVYDSAPRRLSSKGLGAKWTGRAWSISALAGWKMSHHPAQDDNEKRPRIWGQIAYRF